MEYLTGVFSARSMPRDCEAWSHVTVVSIQHPLLEAHVHIQTNTLLLCVSFTARTSSHTNFPLCTVLVCTNTHSLWRERVKNSNAAPAGGRFGGGGSEEREGNAAMTKFRSSTFLHLILLKWSMLLFFPSAVADPAHTYHLWLLNTKIIRQRMRPIVLMVRLF